MWKALNEALPVFELIIKRGMQIDGRCQTCGVEGESIIHALFQCDPARQVWALSEIPHSEIGFEEESMFGSLNYLLKLKNSKRGEVKVIRTWPWLLWGIWKSRNELIFKGRRWSPEEIKEKAVNEADEWFLVQEVEEETNKRSVNEVVSIKRKWSPPRKDWLMCNVGFDWVKQTKLMGVAWVVRNHRGVVLMHSRRAFSNVRSLDEARLVSILWAVESMTSLHYNKVVFTGDYKEIFIAAQKPLHWHALRYHVVELNQLLRRMSDYQLLSVLKEENRGAVIIAQSITREGRM